VDDMSAQPIAPADVDQTATQSFSVVHGRSPYADTPTNVLADSLERQYDQGEALCSEMVFEVVGRLLEAEGLCLPTIEEE
jgi:hypothetical protein